jgi:LPXTG-site transpeptidase (sortase) family protein
LFLMSFTRALVLSVLVIAASAALVACGGGDGDGDQPTVVISTPVATGEPVGWQRTPTATSTPRPSQTASADAVQAITGLNDFVSDYGYPSDASYARLRVPRLGVDARVSSKYVGGDGVMPNPAGPADVVWYDLAGWPGMGGTPGEGGNAIFSGHVDYNASVGYAGVRYRGPGVFRELAALETGDIIEVDYNGSTLRYAVVSKQQLGPGSDWGAVWRTGRTDMVTLYTCGGDFDVNSRSYSDRVVVQAERIQ